MKRNLFKALLCALSLVLIAPEAQAISQKDMQILGRALGFIENGPIGDVKIGIVHDSENDISEGEAEEIISLIGNGFRSGKINLQAEKVPTAKASEVTYPVLFFTEGTESKHKSIFDSVNSKGTITVSTHDECLNTSNCVMVVSSAPKVDIKISTAAAGSSGVSFGSAFRMMITEH